MKECGAQCAVTAGAYLMHQSFASNLGTPVQVCMQQTMGKEQGGGVGGGAMSTLALSDAILLYW